MSDQQPGSFTSGYEEFQRKPAAEVDEAIKSSTIILDTNAILNLYRMKPSARGEYLQVLKAIAPRIWIPRQVADEFHENRLSSVASHATSLKKKSEAVTKAADDLRTALRDFYKLHSLADGRSNEYLAPLNKVIQQITNTIAKEVAEFDLAPEHLISDDPILQQLAPLFNGRVGEVPTQETRNEITQEALRRGQEGVPPGYIDVQKRGDRGIGDYFIWHEILEKATSDRVDILFVSTDVKEDWVRIQCGLSIGPRPELVRELHQAAGVRYHQLPLASFLSRAAKILDVQVSQDTINQANEQPFEKEPIKKRGVDFRLARDEEKMRELDKRLASTKAMLKNAERRREQSIERIRALQSVLADAEGAERAGLDKRFDQLIYQRELAAEEAAIERVTHEITMLLRDTVHTADDRESLAKRIELLRELTR
ncbi:PIN-like domain-containing protein [Streptomyces sp. IBSBF 3136]|uniref:PIN-like domain-containing protein n=1 Tax=Streptomyces sp. IBSBF 3136 TaxID=2903524 RepID=UPI002FDC0F9D